jgi:hypothetical protein
MKKIIISLLIGLMFLMVGCGKIENTPKTGTNHTEVTASEKSSSQKTLEEMSNIEKAEHLLQKSNELFGVNYYKRSEYYLDLAKLYLLKEAVEKGITIDSSALLADKEIKP